MRAVLIAITTLLAVTPASLAQAPGPDANKSFDELVDQSKSLMMADPSRAFELAAEAERTAEAQVEPDVKAAINTAARGLGTPDYKSVAIKEVQIG